MRNIKLILEYDGRDFFGFQAQPKKRTVQSELENAFRKLFGKRVHISSAAGRTDARVHAAHQVVNFKVNSKIPIENIHRALNTYLPEDLAVKEAHEVPEKFHARFQAKSKTYEYIVWNSKDRSPLKRFHAYHFPYPLDLKKMQKAAKFMIGRHDFSSFQTNASHSSSSPKSFIGDLDSRLKRSGMTSVRTIYKFSVQKKGNEIHFLIEGDGFLYNMVRSTVGTILFVGTGKISLQEFQNILKNKNRHHIGPTLPAVGLTLISVQY